MTLTMTCHFHPPYNIALRLYKDVLVPFEKAYHYKPIRYGRGIPSTPEGRHSISEPDAVVESASVDVNIEQVRDSVSQCLKELDSDALSKMHDPDARAHDVTNLRQDIDALLNASDAGHIMRWDNIRTVVVAGPADAGKSYVATSLLVNSCASVNIALCSV